MIIDRKINDMAELAYELNCLPNNYIFRGQSNADWGLVSTLERLLGPNWNAENARKFEDHSIDIFQSKYHIYCGTEHVPKSKLAWLSVMQHYGVPTRLIDFSESPYIALYFAMESYTPRQGSDLAIYAMNYTAMMDESLRHIASKDKMFTETRHTLKGRQDAVFEDVVDRYSYDIAWITEPDQLNARIDRQCGTFLVSGNLNATTDQIIKSPSYDGCEVIKFTIPGNLYENIYVALRKMNINSKVIYGDLSGLARSIKMHLLPYTF
jgi:hypothetical protein